MRQKMLIPAIVVICLLIGGVSGLFIGDIAEDDNGKGAYFDDPYSPEVIPSDFVWDINNTYFPLIPETTYVYEGDTGDGLEHIVVTVLNETKVIMGVNCVVVRDTVSVDGEIVEDTYDWYAQDVHGNVWYMGEDSKEYENGNVVSTVGSWEGGVDGAKPGIIMLANPIEGIYYRQEYYKGDAEDMAGVIQVGETKAISYGSFNDVLVTKDFTPLEPGVAEYKYYAPGIGLILEEVVEGGSGHIALISID